jgi:ABC-type transport system involved in multi-copper enzyme maturation permease subunit
MFRFIIFKELLESIHNFTFMIALLIIVVIVPLGFYINGREYQTRYQSYLETVRTYDETHRTIQDVELRGGAAFRPPSALGVLAEGVEYLYPSSIESEGSLLSSFGAQTRFVNERSLDNPYMHVYGPVDLTFLVSIIVSLLSILLTYGSVAGERDRGTLSLVLSNAVPRSTVISAKIIVNGALLVLTYLIGVLLGLLALLASGFEGWTAEGFVPKFCLGIGCSVLYIFAFSNLGVLVSSLNRRAISAIIALLFCWIFLFMFLPKVSVILSKILKPVKSQQIVDLEKSQIGRQLEKEMFLELERLREESPIVKTMSLQEFMKGLIRGDPEAVSYETKQKELKDSYQAKCEMEWARLDSHYETQRINQANLARDIARVSPVSCFVHLMVEISDTGLLGYRQWKDMRFRLKNELDREIVGKIRRIKFGSYGLNRFEGDENARISRPDYQPVRIRSILSTVWIDLLLLLLYGALFFIGASVAFVRYDVR